MNANKPPEYTYVFVETRMDRPSRPSGCLIKYGEHVPA